MFCAITLGAATIITWVIWWFLWWLEVKWFVLFIVGMNVVIFLTWLYAEKLDDEEVKYKKKTKKQKMLFLQRMGRILMFINFINFGIAFFWGLIKISF